MITITPGDPRTPAVKRLIDELDRQQEALYPPESNHLDPLDVLRRANVRFVVATLDGEVVGCGAVKSMADEYGEIKRMFVTPEVRGMGVGRAILADLEAHLIANGISDIPGVERVGEFEMRLKNLQIAARQKNARRRNVAGVSRQLHAVFRCSQCGGAYAFARGQQRPGKCIGV